MVYAHGNHVLFDSSIEGDSSPVTQKRAPPGSLLDATRRGGAGTLRTGPMGGGEGTCRVLVVDEVLNETVRKPTSDSLSVSPRLRVLRVNRPEARSPGGSCRSVPRPRALGRTELRPPAFGRHAPRAARVHCAPGRREEVGGTCCFGDVRILDNLKIPAPERLTGQSGVC